MKVSDLSTHFRTEEGLVKAADGVSFNLSKGETLGIVGESGSGKSVTALSIMRLIQSPPGKIVGGSINYRSNGEWSEISSLPEKNLRKVRGNEIAMIFQEPMTSLNPVFTCGNQVLEAIRLHQKLTKKEAKEMTYELFKKVKLPDPKRIYRSYPHQLSGGQKQRVMIAMAISCNPSVLIADEPTTALDVTVQRTILDLINQLKEETGMSVIFITHDLGVIVEIATEIAVMYKGKIVEYGNVSQIFNNPQHPYTKGLIACRPPLEQKFRRLPVISDFMAEEEDGNLVEVDWNVNLVKDSTSLSQDEIDKRNQRLQSADPLLSVNNLHTRFSFKHGFPPKRSYVEAVDEVSFEVFRGETLGLVGESGCGKTTLGRTVLRLIEPYFGSIHFDGIDILSLSQAEMKDLRKKMQIIFQDPYSSLNPRMTVGHAIMEPMIVHELYDSQKDRKDKVIELLEQVQLSSEHYSRYPHEFSGGQRQRICIARSLALKPEFIICDESVSALDVSVQAQVLNLLISLREEYDLTYIFISHDLSVVKFMSDRMLVMQKGRIVESGPSEQVYLSPKSSYTRKLIEAIPGQKPV